jgi:hypothetical protein
LLGQQILRVGIIDILGIINIANIADVADIATYITDIVIDIADIVIDIADIADIINIADTVDRCGYCRSDIANIVVKTGRCIKSVIKVFYNTNVLISLNKKFRLVVKYIILNN